MGNAFLICTQCGYVGRSKGAIKGNGGVELLLWLFFIIPGLIYSVWRSSSRHKVCPKCKSVNLIPMDSPRAQKIMEETMTKEQIEHTKELSQMAVKKTIQRRKIALIILGIIIVYVVSLAS